MIHLAFRCDGVREAARRLALGLCQLGQKVNACLDPVEEIRQAEMLVGRMQRVIGQGETHQHGGNAQLLLQ